MVAEYSLFYVYGIITCITEVIELLNNQPKLLQWRFHRDPQRSRRRSDSRLRYQRVYCLTEERTYCLTL